MAGLGAGDFVRLVACSHPDFRLDQTRTQRLLAKVGALIGKKPSVQWQGIIIYQHGPSLVVRKADQKVFYAAAGGREKLPFDPTKHIKISVSEVRLDGELNKANQLLEKLRKILFARSGIDRTDMDAEDTYEGIKFIRANVVARRSGNVVWVCVNDAVTKAKLFAILRRIASGELKEPAAAKPEKPAKNKPQHVPGVRRVNPHAVDTGVRGASYGGGGYLPNADEQVRGWTGPGKKPR